MSDNIEIVMDINFIIYFIVPLKQILSLSIMI